MEKHERKNDDLNPYRLVPSHLKDAILRGTNEEYHAAWRELLQWARLNRQIIPENTFDSLEEGRWIIQRDISQAQKKAMSANNPGIIRRAIGKIVRITGRK